MRRHRGFACLALRLWARFPPTRPSLQKIIERMKGEQRVQKANTYPTTIPGRHQDCLSTITSSEPSPGGRQPRRAAQPMPSAGRGTGCEPAVMVRARHPPPLRYVPAGCDRQRQHPRCCQCQRANSRLTTLWHLCSYCMAALAPAWPYYSWVTDLLPVSSGYTIIWCSEPSSQARRQGVQKNAQARNSSDRMFGAAQTDKTTSSTPHT